MQTVIPAERHIGIDALRLVSMFMVCILHVKIMTGSSSYIDVICGIAVNLFALISGYVCVQSRWKIKRYIYLWMQVAFYCILWFSMWFIMSRLGLLPSNFIVGVRTSFLPVPLAGFNWYFTAYTGLFIVMPFINKLVSVLNKQQYLAMIILAVWGISVLSSLRKTPELFDGGYNMIWLIAVYLVGGYFKKHPVNISWKLSVAVYAICIVAMALLHNVRGLTPTDYSTPFSLTAACVVFQFFVKWRPTKPRIVKYVEIFAPYAFGVYLIHTHRFVWHYIKEALVLVNSHIGCECWIITLEAMAVFVACILLDMCRARLFDWLNMRALAERLSALCPAWVRDLERM